VSDLVSHLAAREAAAAVSAGGRFEYTKRNLYYELVRRGAYPAPVGDPAHAFDVFRHALRGAEREHGKLSGLIRPSRASPDVIEGPVSAGPDLFDYAVRRALVFDRLDVFLLFVRNGFHRKLEIALVVAPDFPGYVWRSLERQIALGHKTVFYAVHDGNRAGYRMRRELREALAARGAAPPRSEGGAPVAARVLDIGLSFPQAFQLGVPVRSLGKETPGVREGDIDPEAQLLLKAGSYAHLEEMPPHALMSWAYGRLARKHEEVGFG
jgi:hypothetical protein